MDTLHIYSVFFLVRITLTLSSRLLVEAIFDNVKIIGGGLCSKQHNFVFFVNITTKLTET